MKIMLIEDNIGKREAISSHLIKRGINEADIIHAKNMTDFASKLNSDIGLFIIDCKLPSLDEGHAAPNGRAILEAIIKAGKNDAQLLAISSYPADFPRLRKVFESHGCILADYANTEGWKSTLDHLLIQLNKNIKLDFLIFCALQEERNPYVALIPGKNVIRAGIDFYDIKIAGRSGAVVLLPKMGLVNAAVTASLCIDRYKPTLVGMSGICGGFDKRANLGQIFISDMVYEYQSGKWTTDGFKQEPYQVQTDHLLSVELNALSNQVGLITELEQGFSGNRPSTTYKPEMGIYTSGSAVIADKSLLVDIEAIHRKVNALDMEVFAIHRAAELSPYKPRCICAKTVVDLCNKKKDDKIHPYGSYVSAKFLIKAIGHFFEKP